MLNPYDDPNNRYFWVDEHGVRHKMQPIIPEDQVVVHNIDGEVCDACREHDGVEIIHPT